MKIPLVIQMNYGHLAAYVSTSIKKNRLRPIMIHGLVDTGSPWTVLTPSGSKILNVPKKFLYEPIKNKTVSLAGYTFNRYMMDDMEFLLSDENLKLIVFHMKEISVLEPIKDIDLTRFPMQFIIGCDFLEYNDFYLHFNPNRNIAYFEKN